jgi:hypothetical protein
LNRAFFRPSFEPLAESGVFTTSHFPQRRNVVKKHVMILGLLSSIAVFPAMAQERAQGGAAGGAAAGAGGGAIVGGPAGAVVGGVGGAIVGGTLGSMAEPDRDYVVTYAREHRHNSVRMDGDVAVGTVVPRAVQVYRIEGRPAVRDYSYAYINGRPVILEPSTRKVVQVIE